MQATEIIKLGNGLEIHFCLDAPDTASQFTMFRVVIHPDAKVPAAHYHENFDETLYGLRGVLTLSVDDEQIQLRPGDHYFIKRGKIHSFRNHTNQTVEILAFANPGVFTANYFKDLSGIVNAGGPPDINRMKAVMLQYGLIPVAN